MATNEEIKNQLMAVHTNFHINESEPTMVNEIKMDSFGSFLTYKKRLPNNDVIRNDYRDELLPELKKGESQFLQNNLIKKYDYDFNFNEDFFDEDGEFNNDFMFVAMNVAARPGDFSTKGWKNFHDQGTKRDQNMLKMNLELNDLKFDGCYATDAIKKVVDSNSSNVNHDFFASSNKIKFSFANHDDNMNDDLRAKQYVEYDNNDAIAAEKYAEKNNTKNKYVKRFDSVEDAKNSVQNNRVIFYKSANVFVEEWKIIQPKQLVVFGGTLQGLLERMKDTDVFKQYPELCKMVDNCIQITHYSYRKNLKDFYNDYSNELNNKINNK